MTITEALAEIKTVNKRIASKREFIGLYLTRSEQMKDPLDKDGGSYSSVAQAFQAIDDLEIRLVSLRRAIAKANDGTEVTIEGVTKSVADWLVWRREIAGAKDHFLFSVASRINQARSVANRPVTTWNKPTGETEKTPDIVVNLDEKRLAADREQMQNILGQLDGQLSLINATKQIDI